MKTFIIRSADDITEAGAAVRSAFANGPVRVVVSRYEKAQTPSQRNYLEFCFRFIAHESHSDAATIREALLDKFLGVEMTEAELPNGKKWLVKKRRSSTDLTSKALAELITAVQQFSDETLGIHLPDPESAADIAASDARHDQIKGGE